MEAPDKITISIDTYLSLKHDEAEVMALDAAGVDNWQGYEEVDWEAIDEQMEQLKEELTK